MTGLTARTIQNMVSKVVTVGRQHFKELVEQTTAELEELQASAQGQMAAKRAQLYGQALTGPLGELLGDWASLHDNAEMVRGVSAQGISVLAEAEKHFKSIGAQMAEARRALRDASPSSTEVSLKALSEAMVHVDAFSELVQASFPAVEERVHKAMMLSGPDHATMVSSNDAHEDWADLARQAEQPWREPAQSVAAWPLGGVDGIMGGLAKKTAVKLCYRMMHKLFDQCESQMTSLAAQTKRELESVAQSMQTGTDLQHRQALEAAMATSLGSSLEDFAAMRDSMSMVLSVTGSAPALLQEVQHHAGLVQSSVEEAERLATWRPRKDAAPELEALAAAGRHADGFREAADKGMRMLEELLARALSLSEG